MATLSVTTVPWLSSSGGLRTCYRSPSASLSLFTGTRRTKTTSVNNSSNRSGMRSALLHCSFMPTSSSFCSSFAGLSLGLDLSTRPQIATRRFHRLVVRAGGKYVLCQTKRNRSRKSLARTHGFRRRMKTTSGRALLKRRRDKGRKVLCTKSNHNSGKHRP